MAAGDIILASSFDSANITYDLDATTNTAGGTVTLTNAQAKTGSYSLRVNRTSTGGAGSNLTIASTNNWTSKTQIILSVWVRFATLPSTASLFAQMYHAAGSDANLTVNSSGDVLIQYGTGSTTTVASGLATNTWHQIEFATDVSAATHKTKARVNNGTSFEITESSSISTVSGMVLGCGTTGQTYDIYYDDLVMLEGYDTYPGKMIVQTLRPNGDVSGSYTITGGDATRWAATDDAPTSTTTYIGSSTNGAVQVLDLTTYTLGSGESFYGLVANGITGSTATTARSFTVRYQDSGGTDYTPTATWNANVNGWKRSTNILTTRVNRTGGALAQADVDGVRFKMTKSADTRLCNMADIWVSAVVQQPTTQTKTLTGGLSFTSAQLRKIKRPGTSATLSFTSAQTRLTKRLKTLTATASFTSAQTRKVKATDTATLSFTSAQTKKAKASKSGTLSFTSAQTKKAKAAKTGSLSFTGAVSTRTAFRKALTATLAFTSAQTKRVSRLSTATLSFTSAQTRKAKKLLTASWSGSGALTRRTAYRQALTGAVSFTSSQTKKAQVTLNAATLSFTGAITRRVRVAYAAAGSFSGELLKKVRKTLTATLSFSGSNSQTPVGGPPPPASSDANYGWFIRWKRRRHED